MNKKYIQSISVFSFGIPILALIFVLIATTVVKSMIVGDFEQNKMTFDTEKNQNQQLEALKKSSSEKQQHLAAWEKILDGDSFTKIDLELNRAIQQHSKTQKLVLIEQNRKKGGSLKSSKYSGCELSIQGTFTEIQNSLTDLETHLPQLTVKKISLSPQNNGKFLNLKLDYIVWEK